MQKLLFSCFLFSFSIALFGQNDSTERVFQRVEQMPFFAGCAEFDGEPTRKRACSDEKMVSFISEKLIYPASAVEKGIEGTVIVSFTIEKDGSVAEPRIVRDLGEGCGESALAVVRAMPRWEPGRQNGKNFRVKMNLPIRFGLKKETADDPARGLILAWGNLKGEKISKKDLLAALETPVSVRDADGNALKISELTFLFDKKKKTSSATVRGSAAADKAMQKVAKKASTGGTFSVQATALRAGKTVSLERSFLIVE